MVKHLIYFSASAATSGKALSGGDLMGAGRMDIAIHSLIQGVFLSHGFRKDVTFHFIFYGMPDPPKHIQITVVNGLDISKKDIGNLIKKILYKFKQGENTEVFPGCFVEKKSLLNVIQELLDKDIEVFVLDKDGKSIRDVEIPKECAFLLGDHEGFPKKELKRLKDNLTTVSVGPHMYFASQTVAVVNNELDYRGI
jgi:tRNA (pseudouridine54-N1)-methyltransferase